MKKKLAVTALCLTSYFGFLIATLPTAYVLNQLSLANKMNISGVSGSVWETNIEQLIIGETSIKKVNGQLSFWSLFTLTPKVSVTFGDSFIAGPEGKFTVELFQEKIKISNVELLIKANEIAQQLPLPLPASARGDVELTLLSADIDLKNRNQCITAKGSVNWSKAGIIALEQNVTLGKLSGDISCDKGVLALILSPKNDLGLTFNAYVREGGKISGNGFLKPGAKFPQVLNNALPFLGKKDSQGRYRLSF